MNKQGSKVKIWVSIALTLVIVAGVLTFNLLQPRVKIAYSSEQVSINIGQSIIPNQPTQLYYTITYPPNIVTNTQKLVAIYNLIEQMRIEHNRQGAIARSNWKLYSNKWADYTLIFKSKLLHLLIEQSSLKESIRRQSFTDEEWKELSDEAKIYYEGIMYGEKGELKLIYTEANTPAIEELKAIKLDALTGEFVDPVQDFTSATWNSGTPQSDPNTHLTVTASKVTATAVTRNEDVYFYRDWTLAGDTDYSYNFEWEMNEVGGNGRLGTPMLSDAIGDVITTPMITFGFMFWNEAWYSYSSEDGSSVAYDYDTDYSLDTLYYMTLERSSTTQSVYIYTDANRTSLQNTLSATNAIFGTATDYLYAVQNVNTGNSGYLTEYIQNLDLQEATPVDITESPSGKAFGVLKVDSTNWSKGSEPSWPLTDGDAYFYIYNSGTGNVTVSTNSTDPTGGVGATLVMGSPGEDEIRLSIFAEGDGSTDNVTFLDGESYTFLTDFAPSDNTSWEMKLEIGSSSETVPTGKTFHVYFLATAG